MTGEDGISVRLVSTAAPSTMHFEKRVNADGSDVLTVTVLFDATGLYSIVGHGETSGHVCAASLTVTPLDHPASVSEPGSGLADTGAVVAGWAGWLTGGLLAAGLLALLVASWARRLRAD
ncbi:type I signal peptidase [Leifsonia xyli subsp. cynodontis DSM 46306]|uniref:Uncharacterized protein n=1 Tax=Leifsonia xyli subsp. cynodontis DSM 46306 TaxID=1389489 RepID=U3PFB1_LEIXC|nr:hypothetical protein [Leifsonia xyli]AGW42338.1 type I signal peptidase [Leifsonia xyli subsp. cynodontis DSM 46306]